MCQVYDCRLDFARWMNRPKERKKQLRTGKLSGAVLSAGAARLDTLSADERKAERARAVQR